MWRELVMRARRDGPAEAERRGERHLAALPWSGMDPTAYRLSS
jgi:hypothetical protein